MPPSTKGSTTLPNVARSSTSAPLGEGIHESSAHTKMRS